STVDSGNFVMSLAAVRGALRELANGRGDCPRQFQLGLADTLGIVAEMLREHTDTQRSPADARMLAAVLDWAELLESGGDDATAADACFAATDAAMAEWEATGFSVWPGRKLEHMRRWLASIRDQHAALAESGSLGDLIARWSAERPDAAPPSLQPERLLADVDCSAGLGIAAEAARTIAGRLSATAAPAGLGDWAAQFIGDLDRFAMRAAACHERLQRLDARITRLLGATDFSLLYDRQRHLFRIGLYAETGELDGPYYDLLASEARSASVVAIATGDVPLRHWRHLGRPLTRIRGMRVLLSWSGTAFEYLMPHLFMACPPHGLVYHSVRASIRAQRAAPPRPELPWGVSESAYGRTDEQGNYRYYAFGTDRLAIRREAADRYVVTPYASLLALPFVPKAVMANLRTLKAHHMLTAFGLYEALDFGRPRRGETQPPRLVQSFMAHHQGMILLAIGNVVHGDRFVRRFHSTPAIRNVEHLLFERLPRRVDVQTLPPARANPRPDRSRPPTVPAWSAEAAAAEAAMATLGNGHYALHLSGAGGGQRLWHDLVLTRWNSCDDGPLGGDGLFVRDLDSARLDCVGIARPDDPATLGLDIDMATATLRANLVGLVMRMKAVVAPNSDVELRRITLTNRSTTTRRVLLATCSEVVLAPRGADRRHGAFSKLFIESEHLADLNALAFRRRNRSPDEIRPWFIQSLKVEGRPGVRIDYETDRRAFFGRNGCLRTPAALSAETPRLGCTTG
ncbi:MAG: glucoamylase family protein, partial [Pseudomonadota bacterium]